MYTEFRVFLQTLKKYFSIAEEKGKQDLCFIILC